MKLTKKESEFLYQVLDQVNVRGLEQKQMALSVMVKLAEEAKKNTGKTPKKKTE